MAESEPSLHPVEPAGPAETSAEQRGACAQLLSKGMYVTGYIDPSEVGHSDGYCWCNRTQNVIGPDDGLVDRDRCVAGRQCFVARV